jgi:multicomponent Na+:H+ antiporter subunit E
VRSVGTFCLGALLWKVCTGYDPDSWILGLPASLLFTWFVIMGREEGSPSPRLHLRAVPTFLLYFLLQSFRTGVDVARRALFEGHQVNPGFTTYRARLPDGAPRAVFANMISLLPGTLSWSLNDGIHKVHILSGHAMIFEELADLERRVGKLYGIELEDLL